MQNLIIFGGKGGVGKSSISTATAVYLADSLKDKKILLISFDIAHNLSDLFNIPIGNTITQITPNLYAIEPDPDEYTERYTKELERKAHELVKSSIIMGSIPELENFVTSTFQAQNLPLALKNALFFQSLVDAEHPMEGFDEHKMVFRPLDNIPEASEKWQIPEFDILIADFPPTGNMIALFEVPMDPSQQFLRYSLQLGSSLQKYVNKFKKVGKMLNPAKWIMKNSDLFKDNRSDEDKLDRDEQKNLARDILAILKNIDERGKRISVLIHELGSLRLVSIPEKPSFEEAKRARELSTKYVHVEGIHINRLIPIQEKGKTTFLDNLIETQEKYRTKIQEDFQDIRVWESHLLDREPIGLEGLLRLAKEVYGDTPISEILSPLGRVIHMDTPSEN